MADWEEIKRLAADFQRTQTSETLQRITERNCIDIVKKLTDLNLIELIYTCDGKEFLTPAHLLKEIEDEIYVNGGRMHLHDLASNLNVDYQHVENKAKELARNKSEDYSVILGQVIHSNYKKTLGKQIADCMLVNGELSIANFSKSIDLPSDFLLTIVKELLPQVIDDFVVSQDERTYYTTDMMDKYKSIIAGTLTAINKPTSIASIIKRLDIPERIFMPIVEGLIKEGRLDALIENRIFTPSVYAREQNEYINTFYNSNSHIAYDVLTRMDIKQPKAFLRKRFPDGIQLKTCFISPDLQSQVESVIEDSIASNSFIDIITILPATLEADDIELLLQECLKKNKQFSSSALIFNKTNICSLGYIATCKKSLTDMMRSKAEEQLKNGKLFEHFLDGRDPTKKIHPTAKEQDNENLPPNQEPDSTCSQQGEDQKEPVGKKTDDRSSAEQQSNKPTSKNMSIADFSEDENPRSARGSKKKDRKSEKMDPVDNVQESDEELDGKKGKGSRKSGGGTQGREIKQKAVKKKYIPGNKGGQKKNNDQDSDGEVTSSKTPRSAKGRAARRGVSPDRPTPTASTTKQLKSNAGSQHQTQTSETPRKVPLVFMSIDDIVNRLRPIMRGSEDSSEELCKSIAKTIEDELNKSYITLAKQILDEFLMKQEDSNAPVDMVE